jgi:hypothetical protein
MERNRHKELAKYFKLFSGFLFIGHRNTDNNLELPHISCLKQILVLTNACSVRLLHFCRQNIKRQLENWRFPAKLFGIRSSHSGSYEEYYLLGYNTV